MRLTPEMVDKHTKRFSGLVTNRGTLNSHLQEIAERTYPEHASFDTSMVEGQKLMTKVYDPTAIHANQLLSAGLFSLLTSSANPWFGIASADPADLGNTELARYLIRLSKIMYHEINKAEAGFSTAAHECYLSYGAFGNFCMFVDEMIATGGSHLVFLALPMSECYFVQNARDRVDTLYRKYDRRAGDLAEKFGVDALSEDTQKILADGKVDQPISCFHIIGPREEFNRLSPASTELPFVSAYIENKAKHLMHEGGYHEMPFMGTRFYKTSNGTYGYGPGATALPDNKMLQRAMQVTIRAAQKTTDPSVMVPDSGFLRPLRTTPGSVNFYRKGRVNLKSDIDIIPTGNPVLGDQFCDSLRNRIREIFFVDQLQLNEGPQMTATEVLQRTEEKLRLMGPLMGRIQPEFLGPLIQRVFGQLSRAGAFPDPPPELADKPLKIIYTSPIARAQEQVQANGLQRALEVITPVMDRKPDSVDVINSDEMTRGVFDMFSVDPRFIHDQETVDQAREERAKQEQAKLQADNLAKLGQGAAGLGQASGTPIADEFLNAGATTGEGEFLQ